MWQLRKGPGICSSGWALVSTDSCYLTGVNLTNVLISDLGRRLHYLTHKRIKGDNGYLIQF